MALSFSIQFQSRVTFGQEELRNRRSWMALVKNMSEFAAVVRLFMEGMSKH
jgi:hypothetical protein